MLKLCVLATLREIIEENSQCFEALRLGTLGENIKE